VLLGVDVGGTFTDAVLFDGDELHIAKAPSTPADQSEGVIEAIEGVLRNAGAAPSQVEIFSHGMTVGTNALLEGRGARTALLATAGFTDLEEIGRQNRPSLYRPCEPKPAPLVPEELRFPVPERVSPEGVVEPLSGRAADEIADRIESSGAESVALCLLFSYLDPEHEAMLAGRLRERLPEVHVSASHQVLPEFREYERCSTTVIDAYLSPLLGRYLSRLAERCEELGLPIPLVMRSSGGLAPAEEAARAGAWSVLSGPAGGAVAAGLLAREAGDGHALGFDMGGTSCDVCVVENGRVRRGEGREIGGRPLQLPMVDVHTVGAGGGSIAWRDPGGALQVGPHSAGADPGPACYGRGGDQPTVTDANLLLGYLSADSTLAGGISLDLDAARTAIGRLAGELGLNETETAEGIVRIANQEMVRALRVVTVERGVDPRRFALLPFGGAGPMHAAAVATELEIERVLCPRASGVLSALGLIASERRRDTARTVMIGSSDLTREAIEREIEALEQSLGAAPSAARTEVTCEMRYRGQAFELSIESNAHPDPDELRERFAAAHAERYGYRDPDAEVELVNLRVAVVEEGLKPRLGAGGGELDESSRRARFDGRWIETRILRGEPGPGFEATGPCVLELGEATLVCPPGWSLEIDETGTLAMGRES
jgi:N-methylhydantoinase A